jgi:cold-inducible RNA-binding protein
VAVRLFIGNLPYSATEAELRAHFAAVTEPSHVAMPVDRETGRPRGFAFVEFTDREVADTMIKRFDQQPFQGRNLAVSEARAREDRPPPRPGSFGGNARPGGGFGGPRPGGFGGPRSHGDAPAGTRDRTANFGPPDPPKRLRNAKRSNQQEHKPRGPIKERSGGRIGGVLDRIDYAADDLGDDEPLDIDNVATRAPDADDVDTADETAKTDDQD